MGYEFCVPHEIFSGDGAMDLAVRHISGHMSKAFIVTDGNMVRLGNCDSVIKKLQRSNISCQIFDEVNSEPVDAMVENGVKRYRQYECDGIVALGGGSCIDCAKAIAVCVNSGVKITELAGKRISSPRPYFVAIPTTAGTGSEATQFTIITDTKRKEKLLLSGPSLLPHMAIVDPFFTISVPSSISANTGVDALCHAMEAFTSRKSQPLSEVFAISAAKNIFKNLEQVCANGHDINARAQMALAATEAGIAFSNSSVTLIHGMSRPIGALFHVPHGLSNAILLDVCVDFLSKGTALERFAEFSRRCGLSSRNDSDQNAVDALTKKIHSLLSAINIPSIGSLESIKRDVFIENIPKMATDAIASGSPANSIRTVKQQDIENLYKNMIG